MIQKGNTKEMKNKKNNRGQHKMIKALRSYLNENKEFFAMAGAIVIHDEQSADYMARFVR